MQFSSFKSKKPFLHSKPPPPSPSPETTTSSAVSTPEKSTSPPWSGGGFSAPIRKNSASVLPEKYEMLCEFFNAMVSSIRMFRLKRLSSTFTKLCRSIESLTDRRFTLHHLAQLKHVLPEVIVVKKICVPDEETNCMKEDLLVTLDVNAFELDENGKGTFGYSHLKGIFHSRIADYCATHFEGDDVPEGELPHLFYEGKQDPEPSMNGAPTSLAVSHFSPSFKRRFSSRAINVWVLESSPAKPCSLLESPVKEAEEAASTKGKDGFSSSIIDIASTPAKLATPAKPASTPAELASTPARLMAATPALRPPKRPLMSPDHGATDLPSKSAKRRSLKFDESHDDIEGRPSQVGDDENNVPLQGSAASMDVLGFLPEGLKHSLIEKERNIREEQDPVVSKARKRQQLMAGVPKLFDMIHLLFQSMRRSVFTKQELIYKIVAGDLDIIDRSEVEERLKLLQEVAPEYISEQCLNGVISLRLNKFSCPESIRAKLLAAQ